VPELETRAASAWDLYTSSPEQTAGIGEALGRLLELGDVVALFGDLGSGKTVFAAGLARGLGVGPEYYITSPTFVLVNQYPGRLPFYHIDLYRLAGGEVHGLGLEELLFGDGVAAIEWPERLGSLLPAERLEVHLHITGEQQRRLCLRAQGSRGTTIIRSLATARRKTSRR